MRLLSAAQLLTLWENGLGQPAWQRAIALLAAALPDLSTEALANLPLGQRDAYLLSLREALFGPLLKSLAVCPACGERLELSFRVADIRAGAIPDPDGRQALEPAQMLSLAADGCQVTFRLPTSRDIAAVAGLDAAGASGRASTPLDAAGAAGAGAFAPEASTPLDAAGASGRASTPLDAAEQASLLLLERCLLSAEVDGAACRAACLPASVRQAIAGRMAAADPQGDVQIELNCPNCAHRWQTAFDPLAFLWIEIDAWAQRVLREVHLLASAYGWREADILALSPRRRQAYLQMVMGTV